VSSAELTAQGKQRAAQRGTGSQGSGMTGRHASPVASPTRPEPGQLGLDACRWFLAAHQGGQRYEGSPRPRLKLLGGCGGYGGAVVQEGVAAWCGRGSRVASAWGDNSNVFSVAGRTRRLEVCDVSIIMFVGSIGGRRRVQTGSCFFSWRFNERLRRLFYIQPGCRSCV
jgi:hypothetical protein